MAQGTGEKNVLFVASFSEHGNICMGTKVGGFNHIAMPQMN